MIKVFKTLSERQKEIITIMFVDELKQNEVAKKLGISTASVNRHFSKAKNIIKNFYRS